MSTPNLVRHPDTRSPKVMTTRAWWLVGLNFLIPGSAQLLAGSRRFGRFAVSTTFILWVLVVVAGVTYLLAPTIVYSIATNPIGLTVAQALLLGFAILWVATTLDTLRLVRLVRTFPAARVAVAVLSVVLLVLSAGTAAYGAYVSGVARGAISGIFDAGEIEPPVDGRYNILLLGGDAGPDRLGLRPDSISVASVDAATGATTIIGVPRNLEHIPFAEGSPLYGPCPNGYDCGDECLISYLYTYGQEHPDLYPASIAAGSSPGIEAMRDAVSGALGMTLQYYVLIDMQGFSDLIDSLGGITIDVKTRQPVGGGEDSLGRPTGVGRWIEPGIQKMDGFTALWYTRARHGTNDYDRMARQREVQEAILTQFQPANVLTKFEAVAEAGAQVVTTDIPAGMLGPFVDLATKSREAPITRVELVPPTINPARPDFAVIHAIVDAAITPVTASPSP